MSVNAGAAYVELTVKGRQKVSKELTSISARLKQFGSMIGRIGGMFGKALAFGGAAGLGVLVAGLGAAIKKASDMQETMNKFNVVFGDSAAEMKAYADTMAEGFGRSKQQVADFLSSAQDLLVPMGMMPDQAADMSKSLAGLAMDLGSFNNKADADVMTDLQAALTGSGEVMKKYGVILDEASVKQELLNNGLDPKNATSAQKAMARYNIILRGTTAAQGDVARSSGSFANQQKALGAQVSDFLVKVGERLLPVLEKWMGDLQAAFAIITGTTDASNDMGSTFDSLVDVIDTLGGPVEIAARAFYGLLGVFNLMQAGVAKVISAIAKLVAIVADNPLAEWVAGEQNTLKNFAAQAAAVSMALDDLAEEKFVTAGGQFEKAFGDAFSKQMDEQRKKFQEQANDAKIDYQAIADFGQSSVVPVTKKIEEMGEAVDKVMQTASPDSLEANSLAAYQKFNENRQNETNRVLNSILRQLERAPVAVGLV